MEDQPKLTRWLRTEFFPRQNFTFPEQTDLRPSFSNDSRITKTDLLSIIDFENVLFDQDSSAQISMMQIYHQECHQKLCRHCSDYQS